MLPVSCAYTHYDVTDLVKNGIVGIDVCITHSIYQVKPHSTPWFSATCAACAASVAHGNHCFRLCQQNRSSESKVKFRKASHHCKRVLEAAKHAYATKTIESITSQKLSSRDLADC